MWRAYWVFRQTCDDYTNTFYIYSMYVYFGIILLVELLYTLNHYYVKCILLNTGTVGVAVVTAGPGLTNTVTAVKNAQMAESPLLLMGGASATLLQVKK